jgi:hypothetical protein
MPGNPIADPGPEPSAESRSGASGATAAEGQGGERFGPLQVRRVNKDDGRALIVYRRSPEGGEA